MTTTPIQHDSPINRIAFGILIACLSVSPWMHGVELPWEQLFFCGSLFAILLLSLVNWQPRYKSTVTIKLASGCYLFWLILMLLYLIPLPAEWVEIIAPATYKWHQEYSTSASFPLSLYPQVSFVEVIKYASLGALFFSVYRLCNSLHKIRILLYCLVFSATLTALYSLLNFATYGSFELVEAIPPWGLSWNEGVRGTFSYKNQYAIYMVMSLSIAMGLLIELWATVNRHGQSSSTIRAFFQPKTVVLIVCTFIMLFTLLNTSSRGALASLILAFGSVSGLAILAHKPLRSVVFKPKFIALGVIVLCVALAVFSQTSVFKRFSENQLEDNGRSMLRQTAVNVIDEFGPVGTGPGTYPYVQHHFKEQGLGNSAMSKRAHNDYLETIATHGYVGSSILLIALLTLIYGTLKKTRYQISLISTGIYIGLLAFLIQSSFDVNISTFYLPALFVILLAVGNRLTTERVYQAPH